jgi:16S rRNA (cytidine1402-2'-O)-methyltransferase
VIPGPSAVETALVASGLMMERYQFIGYLPRREAERAALARDLARYRHTIVAFDTPGRLPRSVAALAAEMPTRPAAVCRELTKRFEEVVRGSLSELAARFSDAPRGEITLVLGPSPEAAETVLPENAVAAVRELVAAGLARRQAADLVARLSRESRNALYRASL